MDTSSKSDRTLVLGLGNRVMTDDAAGLVALERFQKCYEVPGSVDFMDGGTLGLDLLVYMEGYGNILICDCVMRRGDAPGAVLRVEEEDVDAVFQHCLSPHQMGLKDLIAILHLQGNMPGRLTVVGVEGKSIELGLDLTPEVEAAVPTMAELMAEVLNSWGVETRKVA